MCPHAPFFLSLVLCGLLNTTPLSLPMLPVLRLVSPVSAVQQCARLPCLHPPHQQFTKVFCHELHLVGRKRSSIHLSTTKHTDHWEPQRSKSSSLEDSDKAAARGTRVENSTLSNYNLQGLQPGDLEYLAQHEEPPHQEASTAA